MKLIKIFLVFVVVCFIVGVGNSYKHDLNSSVNTEEKEELKSNIVEDKNSEETSIENVETEKKTKESSNDSKSNVSDKSNQNTKINSKDIKQSSDTNKQENKQITKQETPKKEVTKEIPVWEQLGMTENQYKNEPMYDWEHVDFSASKYGSEAKAKEACLNYGDNYEAYLNGKVSYNCSTVTSMSGKYLGEMFYTENLN